MRMNAALLERVEEQLGVEAVPEDNPSMGKLKEIFGDHTFFVDAGGLNIVERNPAPHDTIGTVIKLASWTEDHTQLAVHEPQVLPVHVELGPAEDADEGAEATANGEDQDGA